MKTLLPILGLALVTLIGSGCARGEVQQVKGPDGQAWLAISCKDSAETCWKTAGDFCAAGYETADEVQSKSRGFLIFGHHMRDEMLVRCNAPGGVVAPGVEVR
jgi:hypothetical protein